MLAMASQKRPTKCRNIFSVDNFLGENICERTVNTGGIKNGLSICVDNVLMKDFFQKYLRENCQ